MAATAVRCKLPAVAAQDKDVPREQRPEPFAADHELNRAASRGPGARMSAIGSAGRRGPCIARLDLTLGQRLAIGFGALLLVVAGFAIARVRVAFSRAWRPSATSRERVVPLDSANAGARQSVAHMPASRDAHLCVAA